MKKQVARNYENRKKKVLIMSIIDVEQLLHEQKERVVSNLCASLLGRNDLVLTREIIEKKVFESSSPPTLRTLERFLTGEEDE